MIVLIADDVPDNSDLLSRLVRLHGHDPVIAANGVEALALARQHRPDLIFMDMSMPVMSGYEATRAIRQTPDISETPIIAFTAHAMAADKEACFEAGCDKVMTKPIDIIQLRELLEHFASPGRHTHIDPEAGA